MSIDAGVFLYFPVSQAALEAVRKILTRRKYVLGIQVAVPEGIVRLPVRFDVGDNEVMVDGPGDRSEMVKVPTISPLFPNVVGPEPTFRLEEGVSLWGFDVEVAIRKGGQLVEAIPLGLALKRDRNFMAVEFFSLASRDVDVLFTRRFRSRMASALAAGGGVAAAYCGMGEWSTFEDQAPFDPPRRPVEDDDDDDEPAIDDFVAFLVGRSGGAA